MNNSPLIFIVDDDKDFCEITKTRLEAKGFGVRVIASGAEAVSKAVELIPSVILMDVKMPDKDGIDAAMDIVANPTTRNIPIIFLTSLGDEHFNELNKKLSQQIGARDFFKKGGDYEVLIQKLAELTAHK